MSTSAYQPILEELPLLTPAQRLAIRDTLDDEASSAEVIDYLP